MLWARKPLAAKNSARGSLLAGVDLNATRLRAVQGPVDLPPCLVAVEEEYEELALAVSLESRHPQMGQAGLRLSRLMPHLVCQDFLGFVGEERTWGTGRHRLDAAGALRLAFEKLRAACAGASGFVLAVPPYLTKSQVHHVGKLAQKSKLALAGCIRAPLAQALCAYQDDPWSGLALIIDADEHALSSAAILCAGDQLLLHASESWTNLSQSSWKNRLLDAVADRCIRQSRRDPRDSAQTEQHVYEQLENALDSCRHGKNFEILVQTASWYQNLLLKPEDLTASCHRLVESTVGRVKEMLAATRAGGPLQRILVTRAAERLPGLAVALAAQCIESELDSAPETTEDFGEDLVESPPRGTAMNALNPDSAAQGAHLVAGQVCRRELAPGFHELVLPLPSCADQRGPGRRTKTGFRLFSAEHEE
jgi:hypothetical protein